MLRLFGFNLIRFAGKILARAGGDGTDWNGKHCIVLVRDSPVFFLVLARSTAFKCFKEENTIWLIL